MKSAVHNVLAALICSSSLFLSTAVAADEKSYPKESVRLVLGFAAGGSNDVVARIIAAKASDILGATIVVENRPGAGGAIATEQVAKAQPDGYTLLLGSSSTLAINPHTVANIRYRPLEDLVPVAAVAMTPEVIAVNPSVKAENLDELISLARNGEVSMASSGAGGLPHLAIELLQTSAGVTMNHVPYKGGAPAATDVVGGHVDGIIMDLTPLQGFIRDGRMRAIAVTSKERSSFLPDLPSTTEAGLPDVVAVNWFAVMAPKGTPASLADRLHKVFTEAANDADVKQQLGQSGIEPMTMDSRAEFARFLEQELQRWGDIAEKAGVAVQQ